jgi:hypothetical protein
VIERLFEEKVAILRPHLLEGVPISDLCDELGLQPTLFYDYFAQQKSCPKQSRVFAMFARNG